MNMSRTSTFKRVVRLAAVAAVMALVLPIATGLKPSRAEAATVPALRVEDLRVVEGNSGRTVFSVTLRLDRPAPDTNFVTVKVGTADGTAKASTCSGCPGDYLPSIVQTTFPPGATTRTILVNILGDTVREADETFLVKVLSIQNATVADGTGVVTIPNDD